MMRTTYGGLFLHSFDVLTCRSIRTKTCGVFFHHGLAKCKRQNDENNTLVTSSQSKRQDYPVVYSDGSCSRNGQSDAQGGIGIYWEDECPSNISERLEGKQTSQRAEICAVIKAVESAIDKGYTTVEVRTDSKYTIQAATKWVKRWKRNGWKTMTGTDVKNKEDFKLLDEICKGIQVKWTHVPGHAGELGNMQADLLAKEAYQKKND